ncbi:subtilisin-like protein [Multifurca ochricompacta]|uniref:tripeptidyl-peptidase II n=1 Tax=Multifurca ochricompacta TaxID=376703 RepID=A0AAD4QNA5_9AGAM|nr:subtilisin-like protein [Multifurca ochricompacta]
MRLLLQVLAICALAFAAPSPRANYVVHERRAAEPVAWTKTRRLEAHKILPLRVGIRQENTHELEEILTSISHPESPTYGQHWSPEKVVEYFSPSQATISTVKRWLIDTGFHPDRIRVSPSKSWIDIAMTASEAESLLDTEYHVYTHPSGHEQIGCESYSLPDHVREHVELIKPTVHFVHRVPDDPALSLKRSTNKLGAPSSYNGPKTNGAQVADALSLATCDKFITPECLRALYSIEYEPIVPHLNSYGIVEFTPQAYLASDLDLFFTNFSKSQIGTRPALVSIDGGIVQTQNQSFDFNGESNLDLEYAMALTNPTPVTLLQTGDLVQGAGFDNWLDAVDKSFCTFQGGDVPNQDGIYPDPAPGGFNESESCGIIKPPNVVSISYGQDESSATVAYATRQCIEYGKLGLMGSTVLYSSGDYGVAGYGGVCLDNNGQPVDGGKKFSPDFPATCPFVTAVGATQINPNSTVNDPESACEQVIYSGGGFSNIFPMPSYQKDAVKSYLKNYPPPYTAEQYNNSGTVRAYPDLSANGANYVVALEGGFSLVFGTSASAPVVGSIITLINDARLAIGKRPLGFINHVIYSPWFSWAFNDITSGGNQGCGTPGFSSTKGWDPVTGVGTPNTKFLLAEFLLLP